MHAVDYNPVAGTFQGPFGETSRNFRISTKSLTHGVVFAWFNMRASTRRIITAKPSERYLLLLLLISDMVFFTSWTLKGVVVPQATGGMNLFSIEIGLLFLVSFILRTGLMYAFAAVIGSACRIRGGRGTWRNTRVAVFWGALVAAPFGLLAALVSVAITNLEIHFPVFKSDWISMPPYWLGMLPFIWFIADGVSKAQGFKRTLPVFIPLCTLALVGLTAAMYFRAKGYI